MNAVTLQVTGGRNGYGAKLANIFSTEFTIETCDGKNQYKQVCAMLASQVHIPELMKRLTGVLTVTEGAQDDLVCRCSLWKPFLMLTCGVRLAHDSDHCPRPVLPWNSHLSLNETSQNAIFPKPCVEALMDLLFCCRPSAST